MEGRERENALLYHTELDYAFFAVKFGWTREQYDKLTLVERLFIMKEIEEQTVRDQGILQSTIEIAISNVLRKKGKKYRRLFKKLKKFEEPPVTVNEAKKIKKSLAKLFQIPKKK